MIRRQRGTTTVEFAMVGMIFFVMLFGVIEISRALYVWNTLTEATRRGARVATVCTLEHPAIRNIAVFDNADGSGGGVLPDLSTENIDVQYLDEGGNPVTPPLGNLPSIRYVRVSIVNFQQQLFIPLVEAFLNSPGFSTTLPTESMGVPRDGAQATCFGIAGSNT